MSWYRASFGPRYLQLYAHRDGSEAERALGTLFSASELRDRRVLDLACGAGRYLAALRDRGARPIGLDLSPTLLHEARSLDLPLLRADMRRIPLAGASVDITLSMFTSFGYFDDDADHGRLALEMGRVTRRCIVIDVPNPVVLQRDLVPASERIVGGMRVRERRWLQSGPLRVCKSTELVAESEDSRVIDHFDERVRLFAPEELADLFAPAGFAVSRSWGDYDGTAFQASVSRRQLLRFERETEAS